MARTLDATAHALRRDEFVDVALRLMQTKGWEQMSIQDVLDALDASKGAFYHYFGSKQDLLSAVLDRMVEVAMTDVLPVVDDPRLTAIEKIDALFSSIARWKIRTQGPRPRASSRSGSRTGTPSCANGSAAAWPAPWSHHSRGSSSRVARRGPSVLASPADTARVLVSLIQASQDDAGQIYLERPAGRSPSTTSAATSRPTPTPMSGSWAPRPGR